MAQSYVVVQIPGAAPFLLFMALRQYLQGRAIVRPAMWVAISANLLNVLFNWALIYGHLGMPAMGLVGAGIATTLTRLYMVGALIAVILRYRLHQGGWTPWKLESFSPSGLGQIAYYGGPVALQLALEAWAFQLATLLAGRLGAVELAAHTVALNLASFTFMFPLGLSFATVTRVGNLIGAGKPQRAQTAAWVALGMGAGLMSLGAVLFITGRFLLPRAYNSDPAVIALAASILPVAAAFQIFDGIQTVGSGILRGMGRPRPAAAIHLTGFWCLALPLSWWLTFHRGAGLVGIWWGLCLGLASVAMLLVAWVAWRGPATVLPLSQGGEIESRG
jgi:MATE family multidrug resistance protein